MSDVVFVGYWKEVFSERKMVSKPTELIFYTSSSYTPLSLRIKRYSPGVNKIIEVLSEMNSIVCSVLKLI